MFIVLKGVMAGSTCPVEIVQKCIKNLNTKNIVVCKATLFV